MVSEKIMERALKLRDYSQCKLRNMRTFVGEGSARIVVRQGNYVFKFAKGKKGYAQNEEEYIIHNIVKNHSPELYKHIAEIKGYIEKAGEYVVLIVKYYPRKIDFKDELSPYKDNESEHRKMYIDIAIRFRDFLHNYYEFFDNLSDISRPSSWRKTLLGKPIIVDYGYTPKVKQYY